MPEYGLNIGSRRSVNVITPTFDRDFVTFGTLNHGTGPNITFTRASSATVFTSTGILLTVPNDVPRFEWGSFRTNLRTYGEDFTNWSGNQLSATPNIIAAPNGTVTADQLVENTVPSTFHVTSRSITIPQPGPYTYSVYLKPAGRSAVYIELYNDPTTLGPFGSGTRYSYFNLTGNGSVFTTLGNITPTIQLVNDGWYRCSLTAQASSIGNTLTVVGLASSNSVTYTGNYTGDGSSGLYIWGAQVEYSLSATAFIPTTTSAVTTGVPLGLLIEESRTNLVPTNNVFNWFYNTGNVSVSAGSGFAGLSSYIVSDITESVRESAMFDFLSPLLTATPYTVSCYIRKDLTANNFNPLIRVRDTNSNYFGTSFNEALGSWQVSQSGPDSGLTFITNVSTVDLNTHFRHWFTFSTPTTARPYQFQIFGAHGATPALTGSIEVAGIQVEQGSFPTSYIPTAGLSATRSADSAVVTPISGFYNQSEGTLFAELQAQTLTQSGGFARRVVTFDNNTTDDEVNISQSGTADQLTFIVRQSTTASAAIVGGSSITSITKAIGAYATNDAQASYNGTLGTADTSVTVPTTLTHLKLGRSTSSTARLFQGHIRKVAYWPTRLSNNRLRTLTLSA